MAGGREAGGAVGLRFFGGGDAVLDGRGGGGRGGAERGGAAAVEGGAAVLIGVGGGAGFGDGPAAVWVSFAHYVWVEEGKEGGGAYGLVPEHVLLEVVWQCSYSIVQ